MRAIEITQPNRKKSKHLGWVGLPTQCYLHEILQLGQAKSLRSALAKMRQARQQGFLSVEEYKYLLIGRNKLGSSLLHQALRSGALYKLWHYLDEVFQAIVEEWLSVAEFTQLLTQPDQIGFTPLYLAANSNIVICQYFVELLEKVSAWNRSISLDELLCCKNSKNNKGYIPLCHSSKKDSIEINKFLARKRQEHSTPRNQVDGTAYHLHLQHKSSINYCWQDCNGNTFFTRNNIRTGRVNGTTYYCNVQQNFQPTSYMQNHNGTTFFAPHVRTHEINGTTYYLNPTWKLR